MQLRSALHRNTQDCRHKMKKAVPLADDVVHCISVCATSIKDISKKQNKKLNLAIPTMLLRALLHIIIVY